MLIHQATYSNPEAVIQCDAEPKSSTLSAVGNDGVADVRARGIDSLDPMAASSCLLQINGGYGETSRPAVDGRMPKQRLSPSMTAPFAMQPLAT